jgi:hypothetical protein
MKNTLLLLLVAFTASAQTDSSKVTFDRVYSDVKSAVSGIGSALKVGAEHVYEVLVKQQFVQSITGLFTLIFIWAILSLLVWKLPKNRDFYFDELDLPHIYTFLLGIGLIVGSIFSVVYTVGIIPVIITGFINPEYGAIREILETIK